MRTKLMASVAVALLGMGATAFASGTPYAGETDAAINIMTSGDPAEQADINDSARGYQLAGIVQAAQYGVPGAASFAQNYASQIIDDNANNFNGRYDGGEAYGVARAGQVWGNAVTGTGVNSGLTANAAVLNFYTQAAAGTYVGDGYGSTAAHIDFVLGDQTAGGNAGTLDPTTSGIFALSNHVLASNIVGFSGAGTYKTGLVTALGNWDVASTDAATRGANGEVSSVEALAAALWSLKGVGASGSDTIASGQLATAAGGNTLNDLLNLLENRIAPDGSFYQHLTNNTGDPAVVAGTDTNVASGYSEDLAYGILALKAWGVDTTALEFKLAQYINQANGTPYNLFDDVNSYNAQYSGSALQALPEPATLSLLALGGLGLLARRRRQA